MIKIFNYQFIINDVINSIGKIYKMYSHKKVVRHLFFMYLICILKKEKGTLPNTTH
jgi:hypothetical protein